MNLKIADIYRQKQQRRRVLSALSIREKVEIIEQMRDLAVALRSARQVHKNPGRIVCFTSLAKSSGTRFQPLTAIDPSPCDSFSEDFGPLLAA